MRPFFQSLAGGFVGKILATLLIAICVVVGFGPDRWAAIVIDHEPTAFALMVFRGLFLLSGAAAIGVWLWSRFKPNALEIIFDPTNSGRQFWSMKSIKTNTGDISGIEYRVQIRNKTAKTLCEVKATSDNLGPMGKPPTNLIFDQNNEATFTLNPEAVAFIKLFFAQVPNRQPGMLVGHSASAYGPIRISVSAKDTKTVARVFQLDPFREPMIFD